MSHRIEPVLPELIAIARRATPYPVTLRPDDDDGDPIYVFEIRGLPRGTVLEAECERVGRELCDYCYDRDLPQDFAVVPVDAKDPPPPPSPGVRSGT